MGELPETVRFKNRFALAITTTTPLEAMVEDLLFIRDILDAAGIEYLLVRGNDERPVIAVSWHLSRDAPTHPSIPKPSTRRRAPRSLSRTVPCRKPTSHGSSACSVRGFTSQAA
jgi:hypothetical protein